MSKKQSGSKGDPQVARVSPPSEAEIKTQAERDLFNVGAPPEVAAPRARAEVQPPDDPPARAPLPTVQEVPAACPRCKGMDRKVYRTTPFHDRQMRLPNGLMHRGIRIQNCECRKCRRRFNVITPMAD